MGDGGSTSFWTDPWIENITLAMQYPLLYSHSHNKRATIKETWKVVNKFWDLKLGRNLKENEAIEWAKVSLNLALVVSSKELDSLTWLPSTNEIISTNFFDDGPKEKKSRSNK